MDAERARVAIRTCAKDRAEARMAARNPRSSAKRESRRKKLRRSGIGIFQERKMTGKDVEGQRGSFSRAGTVEVDDGEKTLDNKEEGIIPCAMDVEETGTEEGHELVIAGGAERRCGVTERGRSVRKRRR